jgi:hypothetical protein
VTELLASANLDGGRSSTLIVELFFYLMSVIGATFPPVVLFGVAFSLDVLFYLFLSFLFFELINCGLFNDVYAT